MYDRVSSRWKKIICSNLICSNLSAFFLSTLRNDIVKRTGSNRSTLSFYRSFFNGKSVDSWLRGPRRDSQLLLRWKQARTVALIPIIIVGLFFFVHPHRPSQSLYPQSLPFPSLPHGSQNRPVSRHPRSVTVPRSYYVTIKSNRFPEDDIVLRLSRQIPGSRLIPEVTRRGRIRDTCRRITEEWNSPIKSKRGPDCRSAERKLIFRLDGFKGL